MVSSFDRFVPLFAALDIPLESFPVIGGIFHGKSRGTDKVFWVFEW
jgi:hypothetical protein